MDIVELLKQLSRGCNRPLNVVVSPNVGNFLEKNMSVQQIIDNSTTSCKGGDSTSYRGDYLVAYVDDTLVITELDALVVDLEAAEQE